MIPRTAPDRLRCSLAQQIAGANQQLETLPDTSAGFANLCFSLHLPTAQREVPEVPWNGYMTP